MTWDGETASTDLLRWTFHVPAEAAEVVATHLGDLGADVFVRDGVAFFVSWEEPSTSLDGVAEALWSIVGTPFKITQEKFHRLELHVLQRVDELPTSAGEAAFHPDFDQLDLKEL